MKQRSGSCLCGAVRFTVTGDIKGVGSCHCSKCRKVSGTNGNAVFIVRSEHFTWQTGQAHTSEFSFASGWGVSRCRTCGSPLPVSHNGRHHWVQAGLMDDRLDTQISQHIFCASKADWDCESPDVLHYDEFPVD